MKSKVKDWWLVAEAAIQKLPADFDFGDRLWQLRETAFDLGVQPESLRKYITVYRFVSALEERHADRAAYLKSLPVVAAEAFKRWAERDFSAALAATKTAETRKLTARIIIQEERISRNVFALATIGQVSSLRSLMEANLHALNCVESDRNLTPRIPALFDIGVDRLASPPDNSTMAWCGVGWLANGTRFPAPDGAAASGLSPQGSLSATGSSIGSSQQLKLAIIDVPERADSRPYSSQAGSVIAKAMLASRSVFLVLINLPERAAWEEYLDHAPPTDIDSPQSGSLRSIVIERLDRGSHLAWQREIIEKAWLASAPLGGHVVMSHPGIWHDVMFTKCMP